MRHHIWTIAWGSVALFAVWWLAYFFLVLVVGGYIDGIMSDYSGCSDVSTPNGC